MIKRKINVNKIRPNYFLSFLVVVLFILFVGRIFYLCTVDYKVGNETITSFIVDRNTEEEVIMPS